MWITQEALNKEDTLKRKNEICYQISKEGVFIKKYQTASDASRELNTHMTHIRECMRNKRRSAGGFLWVSEKVFLTGNFPKYHESKGILKNKNEYKERD